MAVVFNPLVQRPGYLKVKDTWVRVKELPTISSCRKLAKFYFKKRKTDPRAAREAVKKVVKDIIGGNPGAVVFQPNGVGKTFSDLQGRKQEEIVDSATTRAETTLEKERKRYHAVSVVLYSAIMLAVGKVGFFFFVEAPRLVEEAQRLTIIAVDVASGQIVHILTSAERQLEKGIDEALMTLGVAVLFSIYGLIRKAWKPGVACGRKLTGTVFETMLDYAKSLKNRLHQDDFR